jgi:hypothetical protein
MMMRLGRPKRNGQEKEKSVLVVDYYANMTGAGVKDQLLHQYLPERKIPEWYIKMSGD